MSNQRQPVIKIEDRLRASPEAARSNGISTDSRRPEANHLTTIAAQSAPRNMPTSTPSSANTRYWCTICASEKPWSRSNRDQWEKEERRHQTTLKQAWSCGFCFKSLSSFHDRLDHLQHHFERGQHINSWSTTKVITGLLRQPGLRDHWEAKLRSVQPRESLVWEKGAVEELQHQLEMGPRSREHAATLVEAAYAAARKTY